MGYCKICGNFGTLRTSHGYFCRYCWYDRRGWAVPPNARKEHYFIGIKSLCGKYIFLNKLQDGEKTGKTCKICSNKKLVL